jgi:Tol biopolymer transport system component
MFDEGVDYLQREVAMTFFAPRGLRGIFSILCVFAVFSSEALAEDVPRVTIATKRFGEVQLMSVGIDGSNPKQLTDESEGATQPTWCPDGSKIAYVVGPTFHGQIKIMDADGKNAHLLFDDSRTQRTPQWSPDGKQIAFSMAMDDNFNYDVFVINVDGKELKDLTNSPLFEADPAWSPDGKKLAYVSAVPGQFPNLCVMNADGSEQKIDILQRTLGVAVYPSWTADGKQITFGAPDDNQQIQITHVNADGKGSTVITHGPQPHSYAAWSPDGQYLTYVSDPGEETGDLCVYDVLADAHRVVLKGEVFQELFRDARPSWVPSAQKSK